MKAVELSQTYDRFLNAIADCRAKTPKNWVPASADEDLVMRSKCQDKVKMFGCGLGIWLVSIY